ncbi:MAG: glycosyltransferase family 4 protein [Chloroflexi bacterium]|nr:glycosyltransferase family 4 protein [Chloroflexota bacterium]
MPRKVAMLLSNPFANDPRVYKEAKTLVDNGYQVTVFAWDRECTHPQKEHREGMHIERIAAKATYGRGLLQAPALLLFYSKVLPRLNRGRFDVIHCHDLETLPLGLLAGKLTKARVIFDAHEADYYSDAQRLRWLSTRAGKVLERRLAGRAEAVLAVNDYQMGKYHEMKIKNVRLVPNYPDLSLMAAKPLSVERNRIVIGRIGALHEGSGIEHLIDAFTLMREKYDNISLKIVGGTACTDRRLLLQKLATLGSAAEFIPGYEYSELGKLYDDLHIWVMPTDPSSFSGYLTPTKFFEALCFAKPVVVSNTGYMGTIAQQENCGLVLDEVTPESIASAVGKLIDNPELRKEMGENGRKAIKEKYNWDISVKELLAAYENLSWRKG